MACAAIVLRIRMLWPHKKRSHTNPDRTSRFVRHLRTVIGNRSETNADVMQSMHRHQAIQCAFEGGQAAAYIVGY